MYNKTLIIILSIIVVALCICLGFMFLSNGDSGIEYENYTVNGTGTTIEIPVKSKIVENEKLINITNDENVDILIYRNVNETNNASVAENTDIMDEKLNKNTKELIQVFSQDKDARNHVINSIKFGIPIKTDENKTTELVSTETDHSKDSVYCSICGKYIATQYEYDHDLGVAYFVNPDTGKPVCMNCAAKLMEEDTDYEQGEQDDGSYIDADGNHWSSYDEYLYFYNS